MNHRSPAVSERAYSNDPICKCTRKFSRPFLYCWGNRARRTALLRLIFVIVREKTARQRRPHTNAPHRGTARVRFSFIASHVMIYDGHLPPRSSLAPADGLSLVVTTLMCRQVGCCLEQCSQDLSLLRMFHCEVR